MATTTSVCMLSHIANLLGEDLDLLEAIVSNDDNLKRFTFINQIEILCHAVRRNDRGDPR
ncbi:hypothetical protein CCR90_12720 [Rhodovulum sulfidophilum]|uniref:hypothetical protein n=1 Tax=Rhodovulum sulfidophilum TaxID=35806 RepID=UPI0019137273|nr:hypothetical protein [Rhodovulum sulfidophilum]MBK5924621.1 hypothetical protein [Rhodovulum sulfidophilum]